MVTLSKTGTHDKAASNAIGLFDSGVGGLSVLKEIVRQLPHHDIIYLADTVHVPYGERDAQEIRTFSEAITRFLLSQGACIIVVACNTASAAALYYLRERFEAPFVGMEPAVKPAAEQTYSQHIGIIATPATFQGELFARLVEKFAQNTQIHTQVCPGLVEQVETGLLDDSETVSLLEHYLSPMLDAGIDSLVLGCTHYPFLLPSIERIVGPDMHVIDPAPAVARQTGRILEEMNLQSKSRRGTVSYYTSGDPSAFQDMVRRLVNIPGPVMAVDWQDGSISPTLED